MSIGEVGSIMERAVSAAQMGGWRPIDSRGSVLNRCGIGDKNRSIGNLFLLSSSLLGIVFCIGPIVNNLFPRAEDPS